MARLVSEEEETRPTTWRDATERALEETAERLAQILAVQHDIAAAGLDLQAVMQLAVERAQALTGADGAMINLVDGEEMVVRAADGIAAGALGDRRPLSTTLLRFAIESRRPLLIPDTSRDRRVNPELSGLIGERSVICVPFFGSGRVIGSLNVMSSSVDRPLTEAHRQMMELIAGMLTAGISHAAEFEAKRSEIEVLGRYQTIFEGAPIGIARVDRERRVLAANPALEAMLGYDAASLAVMPFERYSCAEDLADELVRFDELLANDRNHYRVEKRFVRRDGELVWAQVDGAVERDEQGVPAFVILMVENITERKAAEEALRVQAELNRHQATHDALTGLGNRTLFRERVEQQIAASGHAPAGGRFAVLMADLDRFKEVNDSLGHHAGDLVLEQIAGRLTSALRSTDTVARLGGDEFGVLLPGIAAEPDVLTLVERIRSALDEPVTVRDVSVVLGASVGVALFPDDGVEVDALLQKADVAMYLAKNNRTSYAFYDAELDENDSERLSLVGELWHAIDEDELLVHFEPICRLDSGDVRDVEALARWRHPTRGLLALEEIAGLGEHLEVARTLTLHLLDDALEQCARWKRDGLELAVAVHVTTGDLLDLELPAAVADLLGRRGLPSEALGLEFAASSAATASPRAHAVLGELSALGVRVSVGEFGVGSSSLANLRRLRVSGIKIGKALVTRLAGDDVDAAIVRSVIDLGRSLGLAVGAEGVETREVLERLVELGCSFAQGPYIGVPMTGDEVGTWLTTRDRAIATFADLLPERQLTVAAGGSWRPPQRGSGEERVIA